jgi:hypothetical protein
MEEEEPVENITIDISPEEEPVVEQEEPVVEEPVVEQEEPVVEEPVVEQEEPVVEEPVVEQEEPVVEEPVVEQEEPVVEESQIDLVIQMDDMEISIPIQEELKQEVTMEVYQITPPVVTDQHPIQKMNMFSARRRPAMRLFM